LVVVGKDEIKKDKNRGQEFEQQITLFVFRVLCFGITTRCNKFEERAFWVFKSKAVILLVVHKEPAKSCSFGLGAQAVLLEHLVLCRGVLGRASDGVGVTY
jgi:hypothetical protein